MLFRTAVSDGQLVGCRDTRADIDGHQRWPSGWKTDTDSRQCRLVCPGLYGWVGITDDTELMYCKCGSLGCGIGYGYLHRIPTRSTESSSPKAFPPSGSSSPVKAPLPAAGFNEVALLDHTSVQYSTSVFDSS